MRVLFAPDKFAGTLTAAEAARAMAHGWLALRPGDEVHCVPMADGGPGTVDAVAGSVGGELVTTATVDQRGRNVVVTWLAGDDGTAVLEAASACGLSLVPPDEREPASATTYGLGLLIADVASRGFEEIVVGLGGSGTVDGGLGAALGMGARALDSEGNDLSIRGPVDHDRVVSVTPVEVSSNVIAASDVANPLLGADGAARVFGPQKGADPDTVELLEHRMAHLADVVERCIPGGPWRDQPGAGAAGGLGFGLMAWFGAQIVPGAEMIADLIDLEHHVAWADLVVTGEGSLDSQTLEGKAPKFVADLAAAHRRPAGAIAGRTDGSSAGLFVHVETLGPRGMTDPEGSTRAAAAALAKALG